VDEKNDQRIVRLGSSYIATNEWMEKSYDSLRQFMQLKALGARKAKVETSSAQGKKPSKRGRQASQEQDELTKDEVYAKSVLVHLSSLDAK